MDQRPENRATARGEPIFNAPGVVLGLITILIAIHLIVLAGGENWMIESTRMFAFIPARYVMAYDTVPGSQAWSFLTYAFLHAGWMHLLLNCLWLLVFGTPVARYLGGSRFLLLSAVATICGAVASLALHWGERVIVIGASGAVSGLLAAAIPIMFARRVPGGLRPVTPGELIRHRQAIIFMVIFLLITLFSGASGWTGNSFMSEGGIAWEAHLGGFLGGLAAFYLLGQRRVS